MHEVSNSKGLAQDFNNLGEALFVASEFDRELTSINNSLVYTFLQAKGIPFARVESTDIAESHQFYSHTDWMAQWIDAKGFKPINSTNWLLTDERCSPIAILEACPSNHNQNIYFDLVGPVSLVSELVEVAKKYIVNDPSDEELNDYIMISGISSGGFMGGGEERLKYEKRKLRRNQPSHDAYYPFIDGGIKNWLRGFIEAPDAVAIFIGPPGTGKTSGLLNNFDELGVLPIYATGADVAENPLFVKKMFELSDRFLDEFNETDDKKQNRSHLFQESAWVKGLQLSLSDKQDEKSKKKRFPMLVVEDCDGLLAPKHTNPLMSTLLNQTDGVESREGRKVMFTTNLKNQADIDDALCRPGRCYEVQHFRPLTPQEAVIARRAAGLPEFVTPPTKSMTLAEALRPPRRKLQIRNGTIGFTSGESITA